MPEQTRIDNNKETLSLAADTRLFVGWGIETATHLTTAGNPNIFLGQSFGKSLFITKIESLQGPIV